MALQHKVRYRIIDESGTAIVGTVISTDSVTDLAGKLRREYTFSKQMYLELEDSWDDGELTIEGDLEIDGLD